MKSVSIVALLVAFALPSVSLAATSSKHQGSMTIGEAAMVGTTQLKPGTYKVEWFGSGPALKVDILQNNKIAATTLGALVTLKTNSSQNAVVLTQPRNNSSVKRLTEVEFGGHKDALMLGRAAHRHARTS